VPGRAEGCGEDLEAVGRSDGDFGLFEQEMLNLKIGPNGYI